MTETTNYKLKKPGYEDYVDIGALNANADVIDEELHKLKAGKSDTVKPSVEGNLAALAADGKLQDSGRKPGEKNGVATLDENGHIPGDQLPNSFLPLKGGTMSGPINMNGQRITGLPKPAGGNDPMRKDDGASASTLGLYGLSADGTVDNVLALIGRFHSGLGNEYLWEKGSPFASDTIDLKSADIADPNLGEPIKIAERVSISGDGVISLVNPTEQRMDGAFRDAVIKKPSILHGKYIQLQPSLYSTYKGVICRVTDTATFYANGRFLAPYNKSVYTVGINTSLVGYVNSPDSDAYPPSVPDEYTYIPLGKLGNFARMETGSYIGTGKYGADNPNSLTFKFVPKFVLIFWAENGSPNNAMAFLSAYGGISYQPGGSNGQWFYASEIEVKITGTAITWYASSLQIQMNSSAKYQYLAIG